MEENRYLRGLLDNNKTSGTVQDLIETDSLKLIPNEKKAGVFYVQTVLKSLYKGEENVLIKRSARPTQGRIIRRKNCTIVTESKDGISPEKYSIIEELLLNRLNARSEMISIVKPDTYLNFVITKAIYNISRQQQAPILDLDSI